MESIFNYVTFTVIISGSPIFQFTQSLFNFFFNILFRSTKPTKESTTYDWENPEVVGRNRRPPHVKLFSFKNKNVAIQYWSKSNNRDLKTRNSFIESNMHYLTGSNYEWDFAIIGSPNLLSKSWFNNTENFNWYKVQLPNHWQLQPVKKKSNGNDISNSNEEQLLDIPIYTNTSYPFAFDPPFVRRNGNWNTTFCDLGLGAPDISTGSLNPLEPGENATALYKLSFQIPLAWKSTSSAQDNKSRIFLVFEGVDSCLSVWLNGHYIGYSQDSCLPAEFEVTEYLNNTNNNNDNNENENDNSTNILCLQVSRWCDGSYLEDQDKWWLSGVYRDVYLIKKNHIFIADYEIKTNVKEINTESDINKSLAATIAVEILIDYYKDTETELNNYAIQCDVYDHDYIPDNNHTPIMSYSSSTSNSTSTPVKWIIADQLSNQEKAHHSIPKLGYSDLPYLPYSSDNANVSNKVSKKARLTINLELKNPKLWTAEDPNLYIIVLSLINTKNENNENNFIHAVDIEAHRLGIRTVRIENTNNQLCVNGKPITIAGVNRLEFHPEKGRVMTEETMLLDAQLIKKFNFNAVRSAHYPQHTRWLEICDQEGLYVVDECNIETHGFQALGQAVNYLTNDPKWVDGIVNRFIRMFERDKNYSSIIIWSLGNESGLGQSHLNMKKWMNTRDPTRIIQYESGGAKSGVTDIICPMYMRPEWCAEQAKHDKQRRPVILCEYAHAMGTR